MDAITDSSAEQNVLDISQGIRCLPGNFAVNSFQRKDNLIDI
jgi:hypothetical protein